MAYLTVDGKRRVYFEDHGAGDCALVLIHGWGMDARVWDGVLIPLLADDRRVIVMDHRGCGRSDHDFPDLSIAAIAGDVARLVGETGASRAVLNGWSLGGAVATQAAHDLGDTCAGLILTAGASPIYTQKADLALGGLYELWDADTAVARLSALLADYPMISDIHFWAQFPGESVESGNRRLRYIAEHVLPRLRAAAG